MSSSSQTAEKDEEPHHSLHGLALGGSTSSGLINETGLVRWRKRERKQKVQLTEEEEEEGGVFTGGAGLVRWPLV